MPRSQNRGEVDPQTLTECETIDEGGPVATGAPAPQVYTVTSGYTSMSDRVPIVTPLARWLESVMFGPSEPYYRLFVRAVMVVTIGLTLAWGIVALDVVAVDAGAESLLATAASVAISAFVVVGILQFLVMANVLERTNRDVATTAAELEQAAEQLEETAEELETSADTVEGAAEAVDEAAEDVEQTAEETDVPEAAEQVTEARDRTEDAKKTAESAVDEVESARETAAEVEETAAEKRERLLADEVEDESTDESGT